MALAGPKEGRMKGFSIFLAIAVFLVSSANADDKKEKERLEMPEKLSLRL